MLVLLQFLPKTPWNNTSEFSGENKVKYGNQFLFRKPTNTMQNEHKRKLQKHKYQQRHLGLNFGVQTYDIKIFYKL